MSLKTKGSRLIKILKCYGISNYYFMFFFSYCKVFISIYKHVKDFGSCNANISLQNIRSYQILQVFFSNIYLSRIVLFL